MEETNQNIRQQKIALAQSENHNAVVEMIKDCIEQVPLVSDTEWATIVNAIKLDTQTTLLQRMVEYIQEIRNGNLDNVK